MNTKISVVGLGKLGLGLATCFAKRGFETIGVDIIKSNVDAINNGNSPIKEPELDELIKELGGKKLKATTDHSEAIKNTDVTFVLVATPSKPDGSFSNHQIEEALEALAIAFKESKKDYHLFVISSTVVPGSINESFIPLIEKYSGKKLNQDFGVCYDPDFVALGEVVKGFLRPDLVVIGESNQQAGNLLESIHANLCENNPHIARMSLISGEIAKVSLNAYITMKISFANTLANICEKIDGSDVDAITGAIGFDRRISPYYFKGGLGFGGTCFPRDTKAFISIADRFNNSALIIKAVEEVNKVQDEILFNHVISKINDKNNARVGVLGLSFKSKTPVITESPAVKLISQLLQEGIEIIVFDPLALENVKEVFKEKILYAESIEKCLENSTLCVVTNASNEYKYAIENLKPLNEISLIDCWRFLESDKLDNKIKYYALGKHNSEN